MKKSLKPGGPTPKEATIKVVDPEGKPVDGATVAAMVFAQPGEKEATAKSDPKTGEDGTASAAVSGWVRGQLYVRHAGRNLAGFATVTPASLVNAGPRIVSLHQACRLTGKVTCPGLASPAGAIGWTSVSISHGDHEFGRFPSTDGTFAFSVPPGTYTLAAYGIYYTRTKKEITVRPGQTELAVDPFEVPANDLGKLLGQPAPPLKDLKGWKGEPVKLADLQGKPVYLVFWVGYDAHVDSYDANWIADLHAVHTEYKDRGLEVILVAVDKNRQTDTAEKFAAKVKDVAKKVTRTPSTLDFPFRVGLMFNDPKFSGRNGLIVGCQSMADYGVSVPIFPVLIDKKGNVVGQVYPHGLRSDRELFEKVLDEK
jgi:hypothetical protein